MRSLPPGASTAARRALARALALACASWSSVAGAQKPAVKRINWQADLGYVSATGNTDVTTMSVGDKIVHTLNAWTFTQTGAYIYGRTKGKESANQLRLSVRADASFNGVVGAFAGVAYERNVYAGFASRYDQLLGIQWRAIRGTRDSLTVDGGGVLTLQENTLGEQARLPAARTAVNYKHAFTNKATVQHLSEVIPDVKSGGHFRLNSETAMVAPLSEHMSLKVRWATRFNSAPTTGFGTTDRVFTAGVQVAY